MQQGLQERVKYCERVGTDQSSVYLRKVQYQQLEQKLKRVETWLLQLGQLARLVHYMICQNLVSIIEEKITSFVANILKVRWWWHGQGWAGSRGPAGGEWILTSSPMTSPDPSFIGPEAESLSLSPAGL